MKRVLLAVTGTILGLVALLSFKTKSPVSAAGALPQASAPTSSSAPQTPATKKSGAAPPKHRSGATAAAASATKTYTGQAVQTPYGTVQVAVVASGKHIDLVRFVQLSAYDPQSQEINSYAGPVLAKETVSAQSAQIDTVSGATYTSDGYLQSLQSALDQAGI
jgi:uncharacterized protein with FMN-binding domain